MPETASAVPPGCEILEWDSQFFGRRIARAAPGALSPVEKPRFDDWCRREHVECLYLPVDAADQQACDAAIASGFRLVDVRVTLGLDASTPLAAGHNEAATIRVATESDIDALARIAREGHRDTRFYVDGNFDRQRCDEFYELWITKSCRGWADCVLVAWHSDVRAGYLTCHRDNGAGRIGLVALAPACRGLGAGRALISEGRRWFSSQGIDRVSVVTQGRNSAALGLYQKAGFTVRSLQLFFHKWF